MINNKENNLFGGICLNLMNSLKFVTGIFLMLV